MPESSGEEGQRAADRCSGLGVHGQVLECRGLAATTPASPAGLEAAPIRAWRQRMPAIRAKARRPWPVDQRVSPPTESRRPAAQAVEWAQPRGAQANDARSRPRDHPALHGGHDAQVAGLRRLTRRRRQHEAREERDRSLRHCYLEATRSPMRRPRGTLRTTHDRRCLPERGTPCRKELLSAPRSRSSSTLH